MVMDKGGIRRGAHVRAIVFLGKCYCHDSVNILLYMTYVMYLFPLV